MTGRARGKVSKGVKATTIGGAREAPGGVKLGPSTTRRKSPMWEWERDNDEPNQEIAATDYEAPDNRVADAHAEDLGESGELTVP